MKFRENQGKMGLFAYVCVCVVLHKSQANKRKIEKVCVCMGWKRGGGGDRCLILDTSDIQRSFTWHTTAFQEQ